MDGGYDNGYKQCSCFWGSQPGSYVRLISDYITPLVGLKILDAGCGEGKNAVYLASAGALVDAVEISSLALQNGRRLWANQPGINWKQEDVRRISLPLLHYDVIIAYGLFHCLSSADSIRDILLRLQNATKVGGLNVICAFNNRRQELHAHPDFSPTLLSHSKYMEYYINWEILLESDSDLTEIHPHNKMQHTHSMTRIIARKDRDEYL